MLLFLVYLVGALILAAMACLAVVMIGMRMKSRRVLRTVRRMNRRIINPRQMRSAGKPGASASVIRHRGRASGRFYETPVAAEPTDDGFVIALPYGTTADWLKNLLASGTATIVDEGQTYEVDQPALRPLEAEIAWFPPADRRNLRRFKVEQCVRVRRVGHAGASSSSSVEHHGAGETSIDLHGTLSPLD
jgi:deazaflavin-dependent oxidoreductase (nitroreductase family)